MSTVNFKIEILFIFSSFKNEAESAQPNEGRRLKNKTNSNTVDMSTRL